MPYHRHFLSFLYDFHLHIRWVEVIRSLGGTFTHVREVKHLVRAVHPVAFIGGGLISLQCSRLVYRRKVKHASDPFVVPIWLPIFVPSGRGGDEVGGDQQSE